MHFPPRPQDDLDLPRLEALRTALGITQTRVCELAEISPSTYQRWLRYLRREAGGVCPQPRSLTALRNALSREAARRASALAAFSDQQSAS